MNQPRREQRRTTGREHKTIRASPAIPIKNNLKCKKNNEKKQNEKEIFLEKVTHQLLILIKDYTVVLCTGNIRAIRIN